MHIIAPCLDPATIRLLQRDGLGWGHDLECGCFDLPSDPAPRRRGVLRRLRDRIIGEG